MAKKRLDVLLFEKGLCESRERAKTTIMSGVVFVDGQRADKPGTPVSEDSDIEVRGAAIEYVSRGGLKLEKALREFGVSPEGRTCIDCGASTGGFTDCLLKGGAVKVYAVDVGYGQLAWSIRSDPRVVVMERTNIRYVTPEQIPDRPTLAVIDVSFISLKLVLPVVRQILAEDGEVLCLIKPQFEAGRDKVGKKGVVREASTHVEVLRSFMQYAREAGFGVLGLTFSPIKGPEGNIEYLGYLRAGAEGRVQDAETVVEKSHTELNAE
ncbi:MAG: TlyA family RNA methyltransferase [Oscillospiraceae bacterium]|nr:TlyA family RNA methyltransferase [Oscillospiraceae bacterium]